MEGRSTTEHLDDESEVSQPVPALRSAVNARGVALTILATGTAILLMRYMQQVLIPFVLAGLVFYALDPLVDALQRIHVPCNRSASCSANSGVELNLFFGTRLAPGFLRAHPVRAVPAKRRRNMASFVRTIAVAAAVVSIACGATTRQPTPTTAPPATPYPSTTEVNPSAWGVIPAGQELDVRLQTTLSSETSTVEQRFNATTVVDLMQDGRMLVPAGSTVRGVVTSVDRPGRIDRVGRLTLSFDQITVRGRNYPIRATATEVFESGGIREEAATAGVGAGVGGIVGGIIGGVKGAILGAVIGAGGAIAATEGKDVHLPAGSIIRIRMDSSVDVG